MTDKILYTGGPNPFKGLMGMPEKPFPDQSEDGYHQKYEAYKEQVESIKSNAPDIVSKIEHVATKRDGSGTIMISIEGHPIECKPGDIFPVPVGYEFKKEPKYKNTAIEEFVLRIVKTEVKESKYDFTEVQRSIDPHGYATAAAKILDALKLVIGKDVNEFAMPVLVTIMQNHIKAKVSRPEPEESQKELFRDLFRNYDGQNWYLAEKEFTIQRKK